MSEPKDNKYINHYEQVGIDEQGSRFFTSRGQCPSVGAELCH